MARVRLSGTEKHGPTPFFLFEFDERPVPHWRWLEHRARMLDHYKNYIPGKRPVEWWCYECAAPRDKSLRERLQLFRLGQLAGVELMKVRAFWQTEEERARTFTSYTVGPGKIVRDKIKAYHKHRTWAGIPDELFPPIYPMPDQDPA